MKLGQRGVALILDLAPDLPMVSGDAVQIQQVLVNLVQERVRRDRRRRNRLIRRCLSRPEGPTRGGVEFCVTDNGEGIDPERLTKVFDAYFSTRAGGMGMGLAISRTIIEAHQGRITIDVLAQRGDDLSVHASGWPWRR